MFMAVLKSNSESSGPCIETIINPCNMVLVSLFVPQCCLHSGHTTESPFTFNTLDKRAIYICNQKWNVDINVFIFSIFFGIYQLRIRTKSVFEFHNYRSVLFHGI
jgi:hypothetical protein